MECNISSLCSQQNAYEVVTILNHKHNIKFREIFFVADMRKYETSQVCVHNKMLTSLLQF
jgi:hypothetical protein